jgi:hypothetical protein
VLHRNFNPVKYLAWRGCCFWGSPATSSSSCRDRPLIGFRPKVRTLLTGYTRSRKCPVLPERSKCNAWCPECHETQLGQLRNPTAGSGWFGLVTLTKMSKYSTASNSTPSQLGEYIQ